MYHVYDKIVDRDETRYRWREKCVLFGSRNGFIVRRLRSQAEAGRLNCKWHLDVVEELKNEGEPNCSIIVDIKPHSPTQIFLCEITDIWGHSFHEIWTVVLLRLQGLLMDVSTSDYEKTEFQPRSTLPNNIIYSILYLSGGIEQGRISKTKWLPPGPSSTNSALLWPGTLSYFYGAIQKRDPEVWNSVLLR